LRAIAAFANTQGIPLVFVNLPLSDDYLDAVRLGFERQFQGYLRQEANRGNFQIIDLLEQWRRAKSLLCRPQPFERSRG
jgi:hypothetical protein